MPDKGPIQEAPIATLYNALNAAESGTMPSFTTESFVESLQLDGDTPDGQTLIDRLVGEQPVEDDVRSWFFVIVPLRKLLAATNEGRANPAQEAVAKCLGAAIARQVLRENEVCPTARTLIFRSSRPDLIPAEVRQKFQLPDPWQ